VLRVHKALPLARARLQVAAIFVALGIVLAMLGGATLALAMVTQRYALAAGSGHGDSTAFAFLVR
jgi:hypothetical protein